MTGMGEYFTYCHIFENWPWFELIEEKECGWFLRIAMCFEHFDFTQNVVLLKKVQLV